MADAVARVPRPKGISKEEWDALIAALGAYRDMDPTGPDFDPQTAAQAAEDIADTATGLFLQPIVP